MLPSVSVESFMQDVPPSVRWILAVVVTAGITMAMVRIFHRRTLAFNAVDSVASEERKALNKAAEAKAEKSGTEPVLEPPLPPEMYNLSGRLLALSTTAFVFLLAFTFSNFWQDAKAATSATQAEAAYLTQALVLAETVPVEQGRDDLIASLEQYEASVQQTQWPMMQRGDADGAYRTELQAGLELGQALLQAEKAGAGGEPTWNDLTSSVSDMLEQGRYRIDALPGPAAPGAVAVVFILGIASLVLTAVFQPSRLGANLAIMGIMGGVVGTLLFVVVETSNPYLGATAVTWPDLGVLTQQSAPSEAPTVPQ